MALPEEPIIGNECKLYYSTAEDHATPAWQLMEKVVDLNYSLGKSEAGPVGSRESSWSNSRGALKNIELTVTYRKLVGTDTVFDALVAAFVAGTRWEWWVADNLVTETGAQGPRFFGEIMDWNGTQDNEDYEEIEFSVKHRFHKGGTASYVEPDWYKIT